MMVPVLVFTLAAPAAVAVWQAETFQSAAFAPSTGALWAPAALNASRVFLRAATPIVLPAETVSARIIVSGLPDFNVGGDGRTPGGKSGQRLLAAYRLFVNGVEVAHGPGRGRQPTNPKFWLDVVSDAVELDGALLAAGRLSLAMQCYQASPTAGANGWAMLELRTFDAGGGLLTTHATNPDPAPAAGGGPGALGWMAWNADAVFEHNSGLADTAGRLNENLNAGALAKVAGWREVGYVPTAAAGWVVAEARTPQAPPVPKITQPLQITHGARPVKVITLGSNHWFVDFGHEAMSGIELTVPAATAEMWSAQQLGQQRLSAAQPRAGTPPCSTTPQKCGSHPGVTFCPSNTTAGQCSTPMPHKPCPPCPHEGPKMSIRMSEQLCQPPGNQWSESRSIGLSLLSVLFSGFGI
jgi:hypothetical protein